MFESDVVPSGEVPSSVPAEESATQAPVTEGAPSVESKPTEPDHAAETKKAFKGVQKRIDELTRRNYETEERSKQEIEHWRRQALAHQEKLQQFERSKPGPQLDQYPDLQSFTADLAKFEAERIINERLSAEKQQAFEDRQAQAQAYEQQARAQRYEAELKTRLTEAEKKYPDFLDKVQSPELPGIRGTAAFDAIFNSENGADVMYYLANNPTKAHQIVALSPLAQVREIARIEYAIQAGKTVTSAPPPPSTVGTGGSSGTKDLAAMSYDDFVKARRKQTRR